MFNIKLIFLLFFIHFALCSISDVCANVYSPFAIEVVVIPFESPRSPQDCPWLKLVLAKSSFLLVLKDPFDGGLAICSS